MPDPLPSFERPPLVETVLGVQFAPLRGLSTGHLGRFWAQLGTEWQAAGELEALGQVSLDEQPRGTGRLGALIVHDRARRLRFLDKAGTRVLQIENGWIVYNWRRRSSDDAYPGFATLLPEFLEILDRWRQYLTSEGRPELQFNMWEVTYVNVMEQGVLWQSPADWASFLPALLAAPKLAHLGAPTTGALRWRFPLQENLGHLEITLEHLRDQERIESLRMTQLSRGALSAGDELERCLRVGHDAIVRTFDAMSSDRALREWGRK